MPVGKIGGILYKGNSERVLSQALSDTVAPQYNSSHFSEEGVHCRSPDFHKCGLLELFLYEKCPYIHCCIKGQWGKPSPEKWGIFYSATQILTRFSSGVAYGCTVSPLKSILILSAAIPLAFKASATLPARFSDSLLLMLGLPVPLSA